MLIVVVCFESQLGSAGGTLEASVVVEGEVLEGTDLLGRVDQLLTSVAHILVGGRREAACRCRFDGRRRHCTEWSDTVESIIDTMLEQSMWKCDRGGQDKAHINNTVWTLICELVVQRRWQGESVHCSPRCVFT